MKTVTFRTLMREPGKVKAMTQRGEKVQVTAKGKPLWMIQRAEEEINEEERIRAIDEILDAVLKEQPGQLSTSKMLNNARDGVRRLKLHR